MKFYIYDNTLEGLLHSVATAIKSDRDVDRILAEKDYIPQLFDEPIRLTTDPEQAHRLFTYLQSFRNSADTLVLHAFLSEDSEIGTHIYRLVKQCLTLGSRATRHHANDSIKFLHAQSKKVTFEAHRLAGLIRFRILEDKLQYAPCEPQYNTIGFLAGHFKKRLQNRKWILHDIRRDIALYWNRTSLQQIDIDPEFTTHVRQHGEIPTDRMNEDELLYQQLWKTFHASIANIDRENTELQRQFMPKRYWKYLVEMK